MTCGHLAAAAAGLETAFTIDASRVTFGRGALAEVGTRARELGMTRVVLVTDRQLAALPWLAEVEASLAAAGIEVARFVDVEIEPTAASFEDAARFAIGARADGYISLGGGSVIDTCKAANLLATHPAPLRAYLNAPLGDARAVPGPLRPHLACPTTSGTGSEVTGIAVCGVDANGLHVKTGIASARLRPTEAIIDPRVTATLPAHVVAASGLDVACHAIESFTARAFTARPLTATRPASQGANPWSDLGCLEALRIVARFLVRACRDATDTEAREQMMWAATLAGIAFGNAGVHAPHAMGYAIAGAATVSHGFSCALGMPVVLGATYPAALERHLQIAAVLGEDVRDAIPADGAAILADRFRGLARSIGSPVTLGALGIAPAQHAALVEGTFAQQRLLTNAPFAITRAHLAAWFEALA